MVDVSSISRLFQVGSIAVLSTESTDKVCIVTGISYFRSSPDDENQCAHISFLCLSDSTNITIIEFLNDMELTESVATVAVMIYAKYTIIFYKTLLDMLDIQTKLSEDIAGIKSRLDTVSLLLNDGVNLR